jgi:pimeloyl-ACP methyl ester carboxylesterase
MLSRLWPPEPQPRRCHCKSSQQSQEHPAWQVVLIDLRSHGDSSAQSSTPASGRASVDSAALDVLQLLRHLRLFPTMLVGHSFGGKVILSMIEQFGANLPKPVTAWVLDTVPGHVNAGVLAADGGMITDHPRDLIDALLRMPTPLPSRQAAVEALQVRAGRQHLLWCCCALMDTTTSFVQRFHAAACTTDAL